MLEQFEAILRAAREETGCSEVRTEPPPRLGLKRTTLQGYRSSASIGRWP